MKNETRPLIEVDQRGRISLKKYATADIYLLDVEDDGTLILTPASVVVRPSSQDAAKI